MTQASPHPVLQAWRAFTIWRRTRPFWAGVWTLLSALELWSIPFLFSLLSQHTLNLKMGGIAGISTIMITPIMLMMAVAMWFAPGYRIFAGIFTILLSLLALDVSNLGGFMLGTLLGILGGGLSFSWQPELTPEQYAAQQRAVAAYKMALEGDVPASASSPLTPVATRADEDEEVAEPTAYAFESAGTDNTEAPLVESLYTQRPASESEATVPVPNRRAQDIVPALPSAEDTPMGA
jgi:hypothetical protein